MEPMERIAAAAAAAMLCAVVLRRGAPEFSLLAALAGGGCIFMLCLGPMQTALVSARQLAGLARLEQALLEPVVKTVALSVLTKVTSELCRGAGEPGLAAFVETAGAILALSVAMPLAEGVLDMMVRLLT